MKTYKKNDFPFWSDNQFISSLQSKSKQLIFLVATISAIGAALLNQDGLISTRSLVVPCTGDADEIGGTVFREYNFNGIADAEDAYRFAERGLPGVTINAFDDDRVFLGSTTSDSDGTWILNVSTASADNVLIEYELPFGMESGPSGSNNYSNVRRASKGSCNNDFTLGFIEDHCEDNPLIVTACFPGPNSGPSSTIVTIEFQDSENFTDDQDTYAYGAYGNSVKANTASNLAFESETGFISGLAWDRTHNQILSASFAKLTSAGASNTIGNVYKTLPDGTTSLWLDLESVFPNVAGGNLFQDGTANNGSDPDAHNIGHIGFTDIEIHPRDTEVYLFNANDRKVYIIPVDLATGNPDIASITSMQIPALCAGTNANGFSFSVSGGLGYFEGRVYASTTCTGPGVGDLEGAIYSFDPSDLITPPALEFNIDYSSWVMPAVLIGGGGFGGFKFNTLAPWSLGLSNVGFGTSDFAPWAMDIEFDQLPDGSVGMNIITKNRGIDATEDFNDPSNGGYMTKASRNVMGVWVKEINGSTGSYTTLLDPVSPADAQINTFQRGQSDATFYHGEGLEGPSANGGAVIIPNFKEIMTSNTDNALGNYDSGFSFHSVANGLKTRDVNILEGSNVGFAKGNSWGDLQAMCSMAPIEIGNYVWIDADLDGIQDPNESPQEGVEVELWKDTDNDGIADIQIGTATTDVNGNYYFGGSQDFNVTQQLLPFMNYEIRIALTAAQLANPMVSQFTVTDQTTDQFDSDFKDTLIGGQEYAKIQLTTSNTELIFHDYDAGLFVPIMVGDTVFVDENGNGLQDLGEEGIEGVTATIYSLSTGVPLTTDILGNPISPLLSDEDGFYKFTNLFPDGYYVIFDVSTAVHPDVNEFIPTIENVNGGSLDEKDSDLNSFQISDTCTVDIGENDFTLDAGYIAPVSIGDTVFVDENGNGLQDNGEAIIPGVSVDLYKLVGGVGVLQTQNFIGDDISNVTTNNLGYYKFEDLMPGEYYVIFDVSTATDGNASEYLATMSNVNGVTLDADDSDIDINGISDTTLFLSSSEMDCTLDAGYFIPVSVGDTVFVDDNGNGLQDFGESGIPGVSVNLYKIVNGIGVLQTTDYLGNDISNVVTLGNGYYKFENLMPGEYYVIFDVSTATDGNASDYVQTMFNVDGITLDSNDSDINAGGVSDTTMLITSGNMDCTLDAGYFIPVSVGDTVFVDANGNGLQDSGEIGIPGVSVSLYKLVNGSGILQATDYLGNDISNVVTMGNGSYKFENLMPGQYYVEFDVSTATDGDAADYAITMENANGVALDDEDSDINSAGISDTTMLITSGNMNCTLDAGYFVPVSVGDLVFDDLNGNGVQDLNEPGIAGASLQLYKIVNGVGVLQSIDYLGNDISSVTTNIDGNYKFENLMPGQYYVSVDIASAPNGTDYYATFENINGPSLDDMDSDLDQNSLTDTTAFLKSKEMDCTLDAGYFLSVSIGDSAWVDADLDGMQETGEPGLGGIDVTLFYLDPPTTTWVNVIQNLDDEFIVPEVTDNMGSYSFEGLPPGEYYVNFNSGGIPPTDQDINNNMSDDVDSDIDVNGNSDTLIVMSGEDELSFDAGYQGLDFGDLPDEYITTDSGNGGMAPKHVMVDGKFLGVLVDQDSDGQPSADGNADDNAGSPYILPAGATGNDEDGIEFLSPLLPGNIAYIRLTSTLTDTPLSEDGYVNAWIDFNGDATLDSDDEVEFIRVDGTDILPTTNLGLEGGIDQSIIACFTVPEDAVFRNGNAYCRFRLSCAGNLLPTGIALDGEVEDYVVPLAKLGNVVWLDEDYDGLQDPNDPEVGIANVNVVLSYNYSSGNTNFEIVDTVPTEMDGSYYFCGLLGTSIGKYQITVLTPDGLIATKANQEPNEQLDSDSDIEYNFGKDSVKTTQFMIMDATMLPTGENGYEDTPNDPGGFPDNQVDQTFDFGFLSIDFGDLPDMDFGDLPAGYNMNASGANDPPAHLVTENKRLGSCVDSESEEQPDPMGMGDDNNMGGDFEFEFGDCSGDGDEDGIQLLTPMIPGDTAYLKVTYTLPAPAIPSDTAGYLNGFIDFDGSADFNLGDEVKFFSMDGIELPVNTTNLALMEGADNMHILGFLVPENATFNTGMAFIRFRLSCEGDLGPTGVLPSGLPPEGEVEEFVIPLAKIGSLVWLDKDYDGIQDVGSEIGIPDVELLISYEYEDLINGISLSIVDTTYSDADGLYDFCGLIGNDIGQYTVTVIAPPSFTPTFANIPSVSDTLDSDNDIVMGDTIVATLPFMILDPISLPTGEDGISDNPNVINNYPDTLVDQTIDFGFVPLDYGDLPDSYATSITNDGPVHLLSEDKFLGSCIDAELDGYPDADAGAIDSGDDGKFGAVIYPLGKSNIDDEDGITFLTPLIPGYKATILVEYTLASTDGYLNGWIDYDGDGMFGPNEGLEFYTTSFLPTLDAPLVQGTTASVELCFDVPELALFNDGDVYARFRLSCDGGLFPTGGIVGAPGAPEGEVEDYYLPLAKIGNLAWYDHDLEGDQDGVSGGLPEDGVANLNLTLTYAGFNSTDFGDGDDRVYPVTTNPDGTYNYCGLIPGKYMLLPNKYDNAVSPEDTIPIRYILTIPDNTDQAVEDDQDSDYKSGMMVVIPDLLNNELVNSTDAEPQNENGYLDYPGTIGTFPDVQDDLMFDMGWIPEPNVESVLNIPGVGPPSSGICGHFDVILDIAIKNTGFVNINGTIVGAPLSALSVDLDMDKLFGPAYVGVSIAPEVITDLGYENDLDCDLIPELRLPSGNLSYNGDDDINLLAKDGLMYPDEMIFVRVVVEVNPDAIPMDDALMLAFHAKASGAAVNYLNQPIPDFLNGGLQFIACDSTDVDFAFVGGYEDPDLSTPLGDCWKTTRDLIQIAQLNFSVDQQCELMVDASQLLTNFDEDCSKEEFPLGGYYLISIQNEDGTYVLDVMDDPVNHVTMATISGTHYLNDNLKFSVHPTSQHCNTVWGYGLIEDKIPPTIECTPDTIYCVQSWDAALLPTVEDNCGADLVLLNEVYDKIDCDDNYVGRILRTWKAVDQSGTESAECVQEIMIRRMNLDGVTFPAHRMIATQNPLACNGGFLLDANGNPDPVETGVPMLAGVGLYPLEEGVICNGFVNYVDTDLGYINCVRKIMRVWTVGEWICSGSNTKVQPQFIEIVDFEGPDIVCPADITVSTNSMSCTATIVLDPAVVSDDCNEDNIQVDIVYPGGFIENSNGGVAELPVGPNVITYTAYDDCGNSSSCFMNIMVQDNADPIALCDQFTTVSLNPQGVTHTTAEAIDDGSFDECGAVELAIARMDHPDFPDPSIFGDKVDFDCTDANQDVMVGLLVTDSGGNTNMCMVSVEVQDKVDPVISCPEDVTVDCTTSFDITDLDAFFGEATIYDNCPNNSIIDQQYVEDINQCGIGTILRTFTIVNPDGSTGQSCEQLITFEAIDDPFTEAHIQWPLDYETNNGCSEGPLDPASLEAIDPLFGFPQVEDTSTCILTGMDFIDEVFNFAANEACLKIIRTWTVIDWCSRLPDGTLPTFSHIQIIKINNVTAPVITSATDSILVCSYENDCGPASILDLIVTATDDCTPSDDLFYRYEIDLQDDGSVNVYGNGADASGLYELGTHRILFIVEDKCGNQTTSERVFEIRNCKPPQAVCIQGLSTELTPMDLDGDGEPDAEMSMVMPSFFDASSSHLCGYPITLSFSADVNDTIRVYDCNTLGSQPVELWVTDDLGNQSFCATFIDVQDNNMIEICDPLNGVRIEGYIETEGTESIDEVEVILDGSDLESQLTESDGYYAFPDMPLGGHYNVIPAKDIDPMNGVTTLDLVLIQRHILGLQELDSPFKLMAADINNSEGISAGDLIELRKLILGVYDNFPSNTSWRFIDMGHTFADPEDPWAEYIPEQYNIPSLDNNMYIDFIGVKVGDVNGSVTANVNSSSSEVRNATPWTLKAYDRIVVAGEEVEVEIYTDDQIDVHGWQYTIEHQGLALSGIESGNAEVSAVHIRDTGRGSSWMSYNAPEKVSPAQGRLLYTMKFVAQENGQLSQMIDINSSGLEAEVYVSNSLNTGFEESLEIRTPELEWISESNPIYMDLPKLLQNEPNPWYQETAIKYFIPAAGEVQIIVKDVTGRVVKTHKSFSEKGKHMLQLQKSELNTSGVLYYEMHYDGKVITNKMLLIR